jgi:putative nucleotidyltransferase with HDIG domain
LENVEQPVDYGFEFVAQLCEELDENKLDLPTFPDVALRVKRALADPDISADQIARVVGSDPVFSARLLKVANSALMNSAGAQIKELRLAIMRLGFNMAYNIAVSIAVEQLMKSCKADHLHAHFTDLRHHSVQVAAYAYVIARRFTTINPDEAMLAGLLHDIGKYYILTKSGDHPELFGASDALGTILKDWHTAIGRSILEAWNFSDDIAMAADEHESLDRMHVGPADLTDVVLVANLFSHQQSLEQLAELDWEAMPALRRLQLTADVALAVISDSQQEMQAIVNALEN